MYLFMKRQMVKTATLILMSVFITGCSKPNYQKDESHETDIIGTYSVQGFDAETNEIALQYLYKFKNDETFEYYGMLDDTECYQYGNFSMESINDEIFKIIFKVEKTEIKPNEDSGAVNSVKMSSHIYKYKNMLGYLYIADDIPKSEKFDYVIFFNDDKNFGMVFTQDGFLHSCNNVGSCQCDSAYNIQYIRKNDVIYCLCSDSLNQDYWPIEFYITDIGLFEPLTYKNE